MTELSGSVVHDLPSDLKQALSCAPEAGKAWEDITPLARNEWICWVISAKKDETRAKRIEQAKENLTAGKRRPCCWPGCPIAKVANPQTFVYKRPLRPKYFWSAQGIQGETRAAYVNT